MPQTLIEKIAQRHATGLPKGERVRAHDYLSIRPRHVMTHDNTGAVIPKFRSIGAERVHDPRQPVVPIDHDIQNTSPENLAKYAKIEAFCREQGIDFYPAGSGISHQIIAQEGYATPGSLVVGSDSHSNLYGALACLGTPVVRTDAAVLWATGETWWRVPDVVRVTLTGTLDPGVTGKDVIVTLCGVFHDDEVLNCALEFDGDGVAGLSLDARMTIANMSTEWGALAGVFPFDEVLERWLLERADRFVKRGDKTPRITPELVRAWKKEGIRSDPGATYHREIALDLSSVEPHVAGPDTVKKIAPVSAIARERVKIDKAYLLSCVNSRYEDIVAAAEVLRGKTVAPHVKLYLAAASAEVEERALASGHWQALVAAGAKRLPPGCGPCIGLGEGTLEPGETCISATNRNFKGRMGSRDARAYLASPAVVAASAAAGYITGPRESGNGRSSRAPAGTITRAAKVQGAAGPSEILPGFPASVRGRVLFLPADNLNTDGIYGKDYTYKDDFPPAEMAKVAMANYDPEFQAKAKVGDILVGGRNFGTGSSREQAATALKHRGISLLMAATFNQTYERNAVNNGILIVDCLPFVERLEAVYAERVRAGELTIPTGEEAVVDFEASLVRWRGESFPISPLSHVAQSLIVAGGAEAWARARMGR